jgi:hypothetical protein
MATRKKSTTRKAKSTKRTTKSARSTTGASRSASRTTRRATKATGQTAKKVTDTAKTAVKAAPKTGHMMAEAMMNTAKAMETGAVVVEGVTREVERAVKSGGSRRKSRR